MVSPVQSDVFCSQRSIEVGEQLFGTTVRVDVWLALEHEGVWGKKAFEESDLPPATKQHLRAALEAIPRSRLQLIKRHPDLKQPGITFFVAIVTSPQPTLYEFRLETYADLLTLDLPAIVAGEAQTQPARNAPLYLVCTNAKRDRCCAKFGLQVFNELVQHAGEEVWQTTHLGGHRFAATLAYLPYGVCYGRLQPEDARPMVAAHRQGQLYDLAKLRGYSGYSAPVQAADYYLRQQMNTLDLQAFPLHEVRPLDDSRWAVHFDSMQNGKHRVDIAAALSDFANIKSCSADAGQPSMQYHLVRRATP